MPKPYSIDLRKRVAAFVEAGHSRRAAVAHFTVSPREPAHANHLPPGQPLVSVGYEHEITPPGLRALLSCSHSTLIG